MQLPRLLTRIKTKNTRPDKNAGGTLWLLSSDMRPDNRQHQAEEMSGRGPQFLVPDHGGWPRGVSDDLLEREAPAGGNEKRAVVHEGEPKRSSGPDEIEPQLDTEGPVAEFCLGISVSSPDYSPANVIGLLCQNSRQHAPAAFRREQIHHHLAILDQRAL